jgi:hypothetical protein
MNLVLQYMGGWGPIVQGYNVQSPHLGLVVDKVGEPGGEGGEVLAPPLHLTLHTQPEL